MGRFRKRGTDAAQTDPQGGDRRQGDRRGAGDRRQSDRRGTIDLTRPRYAERRSPGGSRRRDEQEAVEQALQSVPSADPEVPAPAAPVTPVPQSMEDLERQFAGLQAAMDKRLRLMRDMSPEEFEAVQARDEELVTAWAVALRRVESEIAELRRAAAG
ncbi:MAG: hypothetical protein JO214_06400 [Frankiaceae bacterium]|nr:hypothetical protein [Frankiaceae bacterium]